MTHKKLAVYHLPYSCLYRFTKPYLNI